MEAAFFTKQDTEQKALEYEKIWKSCKKKPYLYLLLLF